MHDRPDATSAWRVSDGSGIQHEIVQEKEAKCTRSRQSAACALAKFTEQLTGANGDQYFETQLKGAAVPKLKGKLVSMKPSTAPKELVLAREYSPNAAQVRPWKLENPLPGKAEPMYRPLKPRGSPTAPLHQRPLYAYFRRGRQR